MCVHVHVHHFLVYMYVTDLGARVHVFKGNFIVCVQVYVWCKYVDTLNGSLNLICCFVLCVCMCAHMHVYVHNYVYKCLLVLA